MTRSNTSGSIVRTKPGAPMPALANTVSMPPNASTVPATAASSASRSVTSASKVTEPGQSAATASRSPRPTSETRAPRAASRRAVSAPIPCAAPVMRTDWPETGSCRETNRGSSCSRTTASTASGRHGASSSAARAGVAGRRVVERGPDPLGDPADEPRVELPRERQRRVRPRRGRGDEQAPVGERLELRDPVVLPPRRADEHPRAPQQRPVLGAREHPREADPVGRFRSAVAPSPAASRPRRGRPPRAPRPRAARASHAASTRSRPFFSGFAPYVIAAMSRSRGGPARLDRHRHDDRVARAACGASASPPSLHGTSSGASRQPPPLDRPLPDPVAARAVAGGRGVEADRARARAPAAPRWSTSRGPRAGGARAIASAAPRPAPRAPRRARSARRCATRAAAPPRASTTVGARPPQRGRQLRVGLAQPGGAAEGDQQDVGACHRRLAAGTSRRSPACARAGSGSAATSSRRRSAPRRAPRSPPPPTPGAATPAPR